MEKSIPWSMQTTVICVQDGSVTVFNLCFMYFSKQLVPHVLFVFLEKSTIFQALQR